ncbi:MAG TPA: aspartyl/asparaginyl beta-hydroxylase domain-containing protein [Allosphingosinicella sp.]|nr:aspartyl/asparaginyl beta-hydroxylase domain-containing protein [Allosphingosinicella sp.]
MLRRFAPRNDGVQRLGTRHAPVDDTIEHEAWNDSGEDRLILIFDIWRPELDEAERSAVAAMFEAVDSFPTAS